MICFVESLIEKSVLNLISAVATALMFSRSQTSDTTRAEFELALNLSSGFID